MKKIQEIPDIALPTDQTMVSVFFSLNTYEFDFDLNAYLTNEEQKRAQNFVHKNSQNQFMLARAIVRKNLSIMLDMAPDQVPIIIDHYGRPSLAPSAFKATGIHFSISHTHETIALAFSKYLSIGIDIEKEEDFCHASGLIEQLLSHSERGEYSSEITSRNLAELWTMKEAVLKAYGTGFLLPPNSITIRQLNKDDGACSLHAKTGLKFQFVGKNYEPTPGFHCAIALIGNCADHSLKLDSNISFQSICAKNEGADT